MSDDTEIPKVAQLTVTREELSLLLNGLALVGLTTLKGMGFEISREQRLLAIEASTLSFIDLGKDGWDALQERLGAVLSSSFGKGGTLREIQAYNTRFKADGP